jgi:hypothetical protein
MTTDPDELTYLRVMLAKKRKRNSYWKWPDRLVEERGIASEILGQVYENVAGMCSLEQGQDPPDCEATLDGRFSVVEVTALIDQPTLEQNLRQSGSRRYFDWDNPKFLAALQDRIDAKDRAWKGGYERRVLVIHTDEFVLDRDTVGRFLEGALFRTTFITDAFLGLSYHPSVEPEGGCYPVFRLELHHAGGRPLAVGGEAGG